MLLLSYFVILFSVAAVLLALPKYNEMPKSNEAIWPFTNTHDGSQRTCASQQRGCCIEESEIYSTEVSSLHCVVYMMMHR